MDAINNVLTTLQSNLLTLVVPVAVVGVVLWFIANALTPILPDWAQGLRGYFQKLMLGVAVVGFATTLITGLYSLGGGATGGEEVPAPGGALPQVPALVATTTTTAGTPL